MQTKRFIDLIERAYRDVTQAEPVVMSMLYDPKPGDDTVAISECLGLIIQEHVHMAEIAAKAMYLLWQDHSEDPAYSNDDADIDEAMGDFVTLMGTMRVLPYMHWHCAYFPGITDEEGDRNSTEVLGGGTGRTPDWVHDEVTKELQGMREVGEITLEQWTRVIEWCSLHKDDLMHYYSQGMKISEVADSALSQVTP